MGSLSAEAASFKSEAVRLKEENERLEKQNRQLEKEIQQLRAEAARAQARSVPAWKVGAYNLYVARLPVLMDPPALRSAADAIRKGDSEAVIYLCDSAGSCIATSGGAAQKQGILANELLRISTQVAGGSGGGRGDMAQGKLQSPAKFAEVERRLKEHVEEKLK